MVIRVLICDQNRLEGFINKKIPEDFVYAIPDNKKTSVYNKEQIERNISIDEKMKTVMPTIFKKDFKKHYEIKFIHIQNLRDFRNGLVHLRASKEGDTPYVFFIKKLLISPTRKL